MVAVTPPRLSGERGSTALEFVGILPYLVLAAVFAWQLLLSTSTFNAAENAARAGSRAEGIGQDGAEVALEALPDWLRDAGRAEVGPGPGCGDDPGGGGTKVVVCVRVPVLWPGVGFDAFSGTRAAELPST